MAGSVRLVCEGAEGAAHQPYAACRSGPVSSNVRQHNMQRCGSSRKCGLRRGRNSHDVRAKHRVRSAPAQHTHHLLTSKGSTRLTQSMRATAPVCTYKKYLTSASRVTIEPSATCAVNQLVGWPPLQVPQLRPAATAAAKSHGFPRHHARNREHNSAFSWRGGREAKWPTTPS